LFVETPGIAFAILGGFNYPIRDNRRHGRPEVAKRFASAVERLAHRQGRGVVEANVLDIHSGLPKYERERWSVSQSPRLEAVSVMEQATLPKGRWLIHTDHFSLF
jgi:hypothetical protein